jgi:hypothetical protein
MSISRNWLSGLLLAGALACLTAAFFPQSNEWIDSSSGDQVSERWLGLWFSPLQQTVRRVPAQGGFGGFTAQLNFQSWSGLLVIVGACALGYAIEAYRRRQPCASSPLTSAISNPTSGPAPNEKA